MDLDKLLNDVKVVWWTEENGKRHKHFRLHSVVNPDLWDRFEEIWGKNWGSMMRDTIIGNDYELGGAFVDVPDTMWQDMVKQVRERLWIIHIEVRRFDGKVEPYFWKEWNESKEAVIESVGPDRPEVVSFEILEAPHNRRTRYEDAYKLYKELKNEGDGRYPCI